MKFFFNFHLPFFLQNGTKSLSPNGLTIHSLNMSILCLKNKVDIRAVHQHKGEVAIRKVARFGVDNWKDHKLLKAKTWPGHSKRQQRAWTPRHVRDFSVQAPKLPPPMFILLLPVSPPSAQGLWAKHWRTTELPRSLERHLVQLLKQEWLDPGENFSKYGLMPTGSRITWSTWRKSTQAPEGGSLRGWLGNVHL